MDLLDVKAKKRTRARLPHYRFLTESTVYGTPLNVDLFAVRFVLRFDEPVDGHGHDGDERAYLVKMTLMCGRSKSRCSRHLLPGTRNTGVLDIFAARSNASVNISICREHIKDVHTLDSIQILRREVKGSRLFALLIIRVCMTGTRRYTRR